MKSKKIITVLIVAALVAACGLYVFLSYGAEESSNDLTVQGSLKVDEVNLNTKVAGNIKEILVSEGDRVKAGDIIATIDSTAVEAKKLQAEGALAAAKAQANKAANGARSEEIAQAKAASDYAEKTYNRVKTLYDQGAVAGDAYDQAYAKYTAARETYDMALSGARSEDVSAARALVTQAEGALAEVNSYLDDCTIKAPMDGAVTTVNVDPGELVSTGMPLAVVSALDKPWVEVNVKETDLPYVKLGAQVSVTMPAYPDRKFTGTVTRVNQKPDFATKRATNNNGDFDILSYGVKVELKDLDVTSYPGMTVVVDFGEKAGN